MGVKLSGTLPKGDRSGLDLMQGDLVKQPTEMQYLVVAVDCKQTLLEHGAEGDTYTPTARIVFVEWAHGEGAREVAEELLTELRAQRIGGGTEPFDLQGGEE